MAIWFFVSDLHGQIDRYQKLFEAVLTQKPAAVFLGGDLLPPWYASYAAGGVQDDDFFHAVVQAGFGNLKDRLGNAYPRVFLILGNDDPRSEETKFKKNADGLWDYIHGQHVKLGDYSVYGYGCVPPTPFLMKDWERYDVSRYVDPGCLSPEEGWRTVPVPENEIKYGTIQGDLDALVGKADLSQAVFLFHAPPYHTKLDRAALDGKMVEGVPLDIHIGSIAVKRMIEKRQPLITLHGHVHESAGLTGAWQDQIGRTFIFSAAHDVPELALVRFDPQKPEDACQELL